MKKLPLLIIASLLGASACTAGSDAGNVVVAFRGFSLTGPTADPGTPVADEDGYAHLDRFPLVLVARVTAEDLDEPVVATWPEVVPEELDETADVELELEVPPGEARRVDVSLMWGDDAGVVDTFISPASDPFDVVSNQDTAVTVTLPAALAHGTVRATWGAAYDVASVAWVDSFLGVVMPPTEPVDGMATTELSEGRTYWPIVLYADGSEAGDLSAQTVHVNAGESVPVTLQLTD